MLINLFSGNLSEMYYCAMGTELNEEKAEKVILANNCEYFYTVSPVEITNLLGVIIATLIEYSITNLNGQNYKLHKTKEGNCMIFLRQIELPISHNNVFKICN